MQALQSRTQNARCLPHVPSRNAAPGPPRCSLPVPPCPGHRRAQDHAPHTARGSEGEPAWLLPTLMALGVALEAMDGDLPPQLDASPSPPSLVPPHLSWLLGRIPAPANHPR